MRTRTRTLIAALALTAATAFVTTRIVDAQQGEKAPAQPIDVAEMMAKQMKLATPGPEHAEIMKGAGKWLLTYKFRMAPDQPWMESKGTMERKPILDGRWLMDEQQGDMMGMIIKSIGLFGYDNMAGEYVSLWVDSMSTWPITARGKQNKDGTIEMKGTMVDAIGSRPFRMLIRGKSPDEAEIEMYDTIPPQGDVLVMTIIAKRAK